jgi:hypothetical protein
VQKLYGHKEKITKAKEACCFGSEFSTQNCDMTENLFVLIWNQHSELI